MTDLPTTTATDGLDGAYTPLEPHVVAAATAYVRDERCGSYAGAVAHWFAGDRPCDECARAEWRYRKRRQLDHLNGRPRLISAVGIRRRFEALMALGWTGPQIAKAGGLSVNTLYNLHYHHVATVRAATAQKVQAAFDALGGTWPDGRYAHRTRLHAQRRGWVPPAAWLDIDDPDEAPDPGYRQKRDHDEYDPIVVVRILGGDWTLARSASQAEKTEVVARWTETGASLTELERLTGWNANRYRNEGAA